MSLNLRSIAVAGIGFGALAVASQGLITYTEALQDAGGGAEAAHQERRAEHGRRLYAPEPAKIPNAGTVVPKAGTALADNETLIREQGLFNKRELFVTLNERGAISSIDLSNPDQALDEIKTMLADISNQAKQQVQDAALLQRQNNLKAAMLALLELA